MKRSIKTKIYLPVISIFVILSVTGCIFSYYYFNNFLIRESLEDNKRVLEQQTAQMEYIISDIKKFADILVIDRDIQNFMKDNDRAGTYIGVFNTKKVMDKIHEYYILKGYIQSVGIVTNNNQVYWLGLSNTTYFMEEKHFEQGGEVLIDSIDEGFSKPHKVKVTVKQSDIISFKIRINEIEHPGKSNGYLILNIYYDYLKKPVDIIKQAFDGVIWQDKDGSIIYSSMQLQQAKDVLLDLSVRSKSSMEEASVMNRKEGYYVSSDLMSNGWKYITFTSNVQINEMKWKSLLYLLIFLIASAMVIFIIITPVLYNIVKPITILSESMRNVSSGDLEADIKITSGDELEILANSFNKMMTDLKTYLNQSLEDEKQKRRLEFELITAQINPHFIYNTLNSIVYMARKHKNMDIVNMMTSFIGILKDIFTIKENSMYASVRQEVEVLKHYITVQQYRYADVFEIEYHIDEQCEDCIIPRFFLQQLVENSIYHGIQPKMECGKIEVAVMRQEDELVIIVRDNGVGINQEKLEKLLNAEEELGAKDNLRSIGIANIKKRILYLYGSQWGFDIESKENIGTCITIRLPFMKSI